MYRANNVDGKGIKAFRNDQPEFCDQQIQKYGRDEQTGQIFSDNVMVEINSAQFQWK